MSDYPFQLVRYDFPGKSADEAHLANRPFTSVSSSFKDDARRFFPGEQLETAINTAIAVGEPLLITGEPGTGKTQAAYYTAYKLGVEPVLHFQVKSDSSARDLLYNFDTVRYFFDANVRNLEMDKGEETTEPETKVRAINKSDYVEPRELWEAIESQHPRVLLIDEIDKAPRDFPNDLLHELDKMEFTIAETREKISSSKERRPIVFITSNSERRLPEPFLRRCVYHHIRFDDNIVQKAVENRIDEYKNLSPDFIAMAIKRFLALRDRTLRKRPSTGELLVWLRVLNLSGDHYQRKLDTDLSKLPYIGTLLKDHQDIEELRR
jgi:MoxR-like ATPase